MFQVWNIVYFSWKIDPFHFFPLFYLNTDYPFLSIFFGGIFRKNAPTLRKSLKLLLTSWGFKLDKTKKYKVRTFLSFKPLWKTINSDDIPTLWSWVIFYETPGIIYNNCLLEGNRFRKHSTFNNMQHVVRKLGRIV